MHGSVCACMGVCGIVCECMGVCVHASECVNVHACEYVGMKVSVWEYI